MSLSAATRSGNITPVSICLWWRYVGMTGVNVGGVIRAGASGVAVIVAIAAADDIAPPDRSWQRFGRLNGATDLVKKSLTSPFCCLYSQ